MQSNTHAGRPRASGGRGLSTRDKRTAAVAVFLFLVAAAIFAGAIIARQGKGTNAIAPTGWAKERKLQGAAKAPAPVAPPGPNDDALGLHPNR